MPATSEVFQRRNLVQRMHIMPHPDFPGFMLFSFHGGHTNFDDGRGTPADHLAYSIFRHGIFPIMTVHDNGDCLGSIRAGARWMKEHGIQDAATAAIEWLYFYDLTPEDPVTETIRSLPADIQHGIFGGPFDKFPKVGRGETIRILSEFITIAPATDDYLTRLKTALNTWHAGNTRETAKLEGLYHLLSTTFTAEQMENTLTLIPHPISFGRDWFHRLLMKYMAPGTDAAFPVDLLLPHMQDLPDAIEGFNAISLLESNILSNKYADLLPKKFSRPGDTDAHSMYASGSGGTLVFMNEANTLFPTAKEIIINAKIPENTYAINGWRIPDHTNLSTPIYYGMHKWEHKLRHRVKDLAFAMATDVRGPAREFIEETDGRGLPYKADIYPPKKPWFNYFEYVY